MCSRELKSTFCYEIESEGVTCECGLRLYFCGNGFFYEYTCLRMKSVTSASKVISIIVGLNHVFIFDRELHHWLFFSFQEFVIQIHLL